MLVFQFTDLERSTYLWERDPEHMGPALALHDRILRSSVEEHGGSVVKSTGDGMLAVFQSVDDCLRACIETQRQLGGADWETVEPLRVRIGVHVGEAEARAGDYFGTDVNRAARIMSAAHGGQIVVSAAVAKLASLDTVTLADLGRHRLKDLTDSEHLHQVRADGLQDVFPPLVTLEGTPNNLPLQMSEFVERAEVLETALGFLERDGVRLLTLVGPGGTGKTRLAVQMAAEVLERYPDGVHFVDLSDERTADGVFEAVVRALGLAGAREGTPLQVLKAKLREGRRLLALDNLEQVTEVGPGLADLLSFCPSLEVIATSREHLQVRGEHVFPVPAMGVAQPGASAAEIADAEATRLFLERARSVRPDLLLDEAQFKAVAEITRDLDGLPLAIELAAARLQVFDPLELRDRIRQKVDVTGRGTRDLPSRQQTLEGAVDWSYELLEPDECRLFELLSVFVSARMVAIEDVAGRVHPEIDVVETMGSLVAKSLVLRVDDGGSRFSMLRVIREYAAKRLASDPEVEVASRAAHAAHYTDRAASVGADDIQGELLAEFGNLQLAWHHWLAVGQVDELNRLLEVLWDLTESRGWYHQAIELASDLLGLVEVVDDRERIDELGLHVRLARSLMAVRGYTAEVQGHFERALELVGVDDAAARGPVLRALATYHMNTGDFEASIRMGVELVELGTVQGDATAVLEGHVVQGALVTELETGIGHLDQAIELWDRGSGRSRFRQGAFPGTVAKMASAILLARAGRTDEAVGRVESGLGEARALEHPFSVAYALHHAAYFWLWQTQYQSTIDLSVELGVLARKHDYPVWNALSSIMEGTGRAGLGDGAEALALSDEGLGLYESLTTPPVFWVPLQAVRAFGFWLAGAPGTARPLLDDVLDRPGIDVIYSEFNVLRGDIRAELDDPDGAIDAYRRAIEGARVSGALAVELAATVRLAERGEATLERLAELHGAVSPGGTSPGVAAAELLLSDGG